MAEARFLKALVQGQHLTESARKLALEDFAWSASSLGEAALPMALEAAVLAAPSFVNHEELLAAVGAMRRARDVDVQFVAVKSVELRAARAVLETFCPPEEFLGYSNLGYWSYRLPLGNERPPLKVALTWVGEAQNYRMSSFMHHVLQDVRPRLCILVGMAAGRRAKTGGVKLGDVVLGTEIVDYGNLILSEHKVLPDPQHFRPRAVLLRGTRDFGELATSWRALIRTACDSAVRGARDDPIMPRNVEHYDPSFVLGTIISSDFLVEDGSFESRAKEILRPKAKAAEMEGAGFSNFCDEAGIGWLVFRGIADHGEPRRDKDWQFLSSVAACSAAVIGLTQGHVLESS